MIYAESYDKILSAIGIEYFVHNLRYVPDLKSWADENKVSLNEPHHPMKLVTDGETITMVIQSDIKEEMLDNVITNLSIRWSLKDNVTDLSKKLNSIKKRLVFCFLKEYARTVRDARGDEFLEDEWAIRTMERFGFFDE